MKKYILFLILIASLSLNSSLLSQPISGGPIGGSGGTTGSAHTNGANCAAGEYPLGVDADGAVETCTDAGVEIAALIVAGNAATATALAANGGNCGAGEYALGVDASGAVESCTDASTEITTYAEPADATIIKQADVDDTPDNGDTTTPPSANWAFDHDADATAHHAAVTVATLGVDDLVTLSGVAAGEPDLGAFSGGTITDDSTTKVALQELETSLEGMVTAVLDCASGDCDSLIDAPFAFTSTDTTPSVAAGSVFITANGAGTTIDDFDTDITNGKIIFVIVNDANSTFDFTASGLEGLAGDYLATNGEVLMFIYTTVDDQWHYNGFPKTLTSVTISGFTATRPVYSDASGNLVVGDNGGDLEISGDDYQIKAGVVDEDMLAASIVFDDGDLLDFGTFVTGVTEGIMLPAHATDCSTATAEGQVCWEEDAEILWVGNGAAPVNINGVGTLSKTMIIETPTDADNFLFFRTEGNITVTGIDCISEDATSAVITVQECDGDGDNCGTTEAAITCAVTNTAHAATIDTPGIEAGDWVRIDVGAVVGTPGHVAVTVNYTKDTNW